MIRVAVASDDAYLPWTATLIRSVLDEHPAADVRFHVLAPTETAGIGRLRTWVEDLGGSLEVHELDITSFGGLPSVGRFGRIVWSRFLLPELLPRESSVLYLDADTLVVSSLEDLWTTQMDEPVGAVANVVEPSLHAHVRSLGIEDVRRFFNSGVLLMNLDQMRDVLAELPRRISGLERLRWPDQDALNVLYADRWKELHPRWNAMSSLWTWRAWADDTFGAGRAEEARTSPSILHFEGPSISKPWHYLCAHPFAKRYRMTLSRTPWADVPLVGRTVTTRMISVLPRRWWTGTYVRLARWRERLGRLTGR